MQRRPTVAVACALALLLAAEQDCGVCGPGYEGPVLPLPADTASLDCTVTLQGATGHAAYDCPAPSGSSVVDCTPPAGLNVTGAVQRDAPQSSGGGGQVSVAFEDGHTPDATTMKAWLGGPDFSLTVACGGTQVLQRQNQSIAQVCVGE